MKSKTSYIMNLFLGALSYCTYQVKRFVKKISFMDRYDKVIAIGILVVLALLIFSPFMIISPNTSAITTSYRFLLSLSFIKSFIIIVWPLLIILLLLFNKRTKLLFIERFWFQGNLHLISVLLLAISLSNLVALGEAIKLVSDYTTVVKLTSMYYILQILLIVLLSFCIFIIFSTQHLHYRGHVVGYHGKNWSKKNESESGGLFDEVQHDER